MLTPRTLEAAEIRLNAYLESRQETNAVSSTSTNSRQGGASSQHDGHALENPVLRELWETTATPLPIAPTPTAVDEKLEPLNEAEAIDVLRGMSACSSSSHDELRRLLCVGTRRFFPKYGVAMREGAEGNGVFIVLQGKLQLQPSNIDRQASKRANAGQEAASKARSDMGIIGPSAFFGELGVVIDELPRMCSAIFLEDSELLHITSEQLDQLPPKQAHSLRQSLKDAFVTKALKTVPFFMTLPESTQRQIAGFFEIEHFLSGDFICRQGDPGDRMYIIVVGRVEVWRKKKREAPREMIAEYTGLSPYPWFGEVLQWVNDHGRAGDVIVTEDTLTFMLHRDHVNDFVFLVPGFKALAMSAASAFTIKTLKVKNTRAEESNPIQRRIDPPLKFAIHWVRLVTKLVGSSYDKIVKAKLQEMRQKNDNTMSWVQHLLNVRVVGGDEVAAEPLVVLPQEDEDDDAQRFDPQTAYEEQRRKLLAHAHEKHFGDTKTLAEAATVGKYWRHEWGVDWRVRTELLRRPEFEWELARARAKVTYKRDRPQESFPPRQPPAEEVDDDDDW